MAADGLITRPCDFGPKEAADRFEAAIKAKGMAVFARIDHAAGAAAAGRRHSGHKKTPTAENRGRGRSKLESRNDDGVE